MTTSLPGRALVAALALVLVTEQALAFPSRREPLEKLDRIARAQCGDDRGRVPERRVRRLLNQAVSESSTTGGYEAVERYLRYFADCMAMSNKEWDLRSEGDPATRVAILAAPDPKEKPVSKGSPGTMFWLAGGAGYQSWLNGSPDASGRVILSWHFDDDGGPLHFGDLVLAAGVDTAIARTNIDADLAPGPRLYPRKHEDFYEWQPVTLESTLQVVPTLALLWNTTPNDTDHFVEHAGIQWRRYMIQNPDLNSPLRTFAIEASFLATTPLNRRVLTVLEVHAGALRASNDGPCPEDEYTGTGHCSIWGASLGAGLWLAWWPG
jgi:hypothetical protein